METVGESHVDPALPKSTFFHIGQDEKCFSRGESIYKSTIQNDYPAYGLFTKQKRVASPKLSEILSVEPRINENKSLTSTHFTRKTAEPATLAEVSKLGFGTKNLMKMDIEERTTSFETTHKVYFPARVLEKFRKKEDRMKSYIPQGDKEKITLPASNYVQSYEGSQLSRLNKASPATFKTADVFQGDRKSYDGLFETTNEKTFRGQCSSPVQRMEVIKNDGCSIRHGDPEKCRYSVTTNQKFFKEKPIDRVPPCGPRYKSNVVLGSDVCGDWSLSNHMRMGGGESSLCFARTQLLSKLAKSKMAKSSLSLGDLDPKRAQQRITQTTSGSFFGKPRVIFPYVKVNGSQLLTKSKIKFGGENGVAENHYNTTTQSNFPPQSEPVRRMDYENSRTNSDVCLDYYGNESNPSTTFSDFRPYIGAKRLLPNRDGLSKLIDSHIQLPRALTSEFRTTHDVSYPPRCVPRRETYEVGKLHKSSIKLGNVERSLSSG